MPNAFMNLIAKVLAFSDAISNSNPLLKNVDWDREQLGIPVTDPRATPYTIDPQATFLVFNGQRTTAIDGTTAFTVTLSPLDPSTYRFTAVSGTPPGLRTNRNLALNGSAVTIAVNANQTVNISVVSAADFTGTIVGDIVFIPGPITGDAATPFSALNQGFWQVLSVVTSKNLVLTRLPGQSFSGTSETQTLTASSQVQAFSAAGVQVGDIVDITAGFSVGTRTTFVVKTVTATFFEIVASTPIALDTSVLPGATGLIFYTLGRTFLYIEVDQEAAVQVNNDVGQTQRVAPIIPADPLNVGIYMKKGPAYALSIVNRTVFPLHALVISAL